MEHASQAAASHLFNGKSTGWHERAYPWLRLSLARLLTPGATQSRRHRGLWWAYPPKKASSHPKL